MGLGALLYPRRQRCESCRRYFGPLVLAGQWCSYECAGHPAPSPRWRDWPREHFKYDGRGARTAKRYYLAQEMAALATGALPDRDELQAYLCGYCLLWHIGHPPVTPSGTLTSQQDALD